MRPVKSGEASPGGSMVAALVGTFVTMNYSAETNSWTYKFYGVRDTWNKVHHATLRSADGPSPALMRGALFPGRDLAMSNMASSMRIRASDKRNFNILSDTLGLRKFDAKTALVDRKTYPIVRVLNLLAYTGLTPEHLPIALDIIDKITHGMPKHLRTIERTDAEEAKLTKRETYLAQFFLRALLSIPANQPPPCAFNHATADAYQPRMARIINEFTRPDCIWEGAMRNLIRQFWEKNSWMFQFPEPIPIGNIRAMASYDFDFPNDWRPSSQNQDHKIQIAPLPSNAFPVPPPVAFAAAPLQSFNMPPQAAPVLAWMPEQIPTNTYYQPTPTYLQPFPLAGYVSPYADPEYVMEMPLQASAPFANQSHFVQTPQPSNAYVGYSAATSQYPYYTQSTPCLAGFFVESVDDGQVYAVEYPAEVIEFTSGQDHMVDAAATVPTHEGNLPQ